MSKSAKTYSWGQVNEVLFRSLGMSPAAIVQVLFVMPKGAKGVKSELTWEEINEALLASKMPPARIVRVRAAL